MKFGHLAKMAMHVQFALVISIFWLQLVAAFSWGGDRRALPHHRGQTPSTAIPSPSEAVEVQSRLSNLYAVALTELKELESEPQCHRVAARLLVDNCQVLDGMDEATILIDSGRSVRDFVDAYAASLAICDLERGSFTIPTQCEKLRETELSKLAIQKSHGLHLSSREISECLGGLAASDSAWNTWISYRHKALRFCDAARADHEKDQSILLYQRLAKVMGKLTDGAESDLQKIMNIWDLRAQQTSDNLDRLVPQIDRLKAGLARVEEHMTHEIDLILKRSADAAKDGMENASNLRQVLAVLIDMVLQANSQVAAAHEHSLARATARADEGLNTLISAMTTALASSATLQNQIEISHLQAAEIAHRQEKLEEGMQRLFLATEELSFSYRNHAGLLDQARNITYDILDTLEDTASTAETVLRSFESSASTWWPYIVCPAASLVLGSYGLPPSAARNLALLLAGELLGMGISLLQKSPLHLGTALFSHAIFSNNTSTVL